MEKDIIDLSYLTEEERVQIMAVIDADLDLRVQGLRWDNAQCLNINTVEPGVVPLCLPS